MLHCLIIGQCWRVIFVMFPFTGYWKMDKQIQSAASAYLYSRLIKNYSYYALVSVYLLVLLFWNPVSTVIIVL